MNNKTRPTLIYVIVALTALTVTRAQAIYFLFTLEMFGGTSPDEWLGPWVTDSILGIMLPLVIYFILNGSGMKTWALIIVYSALGSFDYANGLVTEWLHPLPEETAGRMLVFSALAATLTFQIVATYLLFQDKAVGHFFKQNH
ncbi:hypothetical protein QWY85_18950 [Neolewinella lacunae]|uniref:Uncharacterized protein n=1 Tax=Neolewinella lacunae TaxID=1517758 RepID=A0A923PLX2_9BACT|nr:hypothetical protein [Neolewinella lacunae]MBC6994096.1 hypothetical protein [Neolewinella lacunae]MDN3636755.1 hypothetical protein [Neolewinella lacunae]